MDITLLVGIIIFAVMWAFGRFLKTYNDLKQQELDKLLSHVESIIHVVKEEKIDNQIYWYDTHTEEFLGQGKTEDDVISTIKSRYPKHHFLFMDDLDDEIVERIVAPTWKREPVEFIQQ